MKQRDALLRTCASCEWVFRRAKDDSTGCPKCGFAHYGARFVYGSKCYRYEKTQEPWKRRKMDDYEVRLNVEIEQSLKDTPTNFGTCFSPFR